MIVVMKRKASVSDIARVISRIESLGLKPHPSRGAHQTIIGVVGSDGSGLESELASLELMPGVEQALPVAKSFKLVSREFKPDPTVVKVNGISVGGPDLVVIAGPCAVESLEQIVATAKGVRDAGARVLRGGAFKPRTSPYSFQGHGEKGLEMLLEAKRATGLAIVTEVMSPELVPLVAKYADILQVGARNMQNYALLEAVGRIRKPVLLKRGLMSTVEELLLAAEYVLSNGNGAVMLCERGIRTFEKATRNTLDIAAVSVIKHSSHLPVVVDPSHATGHREYVASAAKAAVAAGADAIMVEVHPAPEEAMSDGEQSLSLDEFRDMMRELVPIASAVGRRLAASP